MSEGRKIRNFVWCAAASGLKPPAAARPIRTQEGKSEVRGVYLLIGELIYLCRTFSFLSLSDHIALGVPGLPSISSVSLTSYFYLFCLSFPPGLDLCPPSFSLCCLSFSFTISIVLSSSCCVYGWGVNCTVTKHPVYWCCLRDFSCVLCCRDRMSDLLSN